MQTAQKTFVDSSPPGVEPHRRPRKTYFVNPRLQWQLVFGANVLALISLGMLITLWYYTQAHLDSLAPVLNMAQGHSLMEEIRASEAKFTRLCIVIGAVQFVLFNLCAIFLSHRIAGPLYRLQRHLEAVGSGGEPNNVKFRRGDLYQALAEACNNVMARMREAALARTR
jgi:hypothetical protein